MGKKSVNKLIQAKLYRLEELKKYQAYYGPNTPYPVIVEINDLEIELQRLLQPAPTRSAPVTKKKVVKKKKNQVPLWQFWRLSGATFDAIATIAFFGLVFLFGTIVFAAYVQTRPGHRNTTVAYFNPLAPSVPTLRPTFTPTPNSGGALLTASGGAIDGSTYLPTPGEAPTEVPTPVPTLTPSATVPPTEIPAPTDTPQPTSPPPTAPPAPVPAVQSTPVIRSDAAPAAAAPTADQPGAPPQSAFPFSIGEQGNREFQHTNYHVITIYAAAVSAGNVPIGGLKLVGDHVPSGMHAESGLSEWHWSVVNCLECDYVKQGNLKLEPGPFTDGVWNIYLADQNGTPVSPVLPLTYSADPAQWVWDFVIFRKNS